ncbi:MAG TPA: CoA transferase [Trueperaceae bacterium]|nr:CoA transferase [Trueperaceae bacterium]
MLSDLLVLDLSRVLAGPYCTQLLADLGARVIKVESFNGDETRHWGPPYLEGESGYYLSINRGKEGMVVDFKDPRGRAIIEKLASKADVLVENFKVGDLERFGLDYASLAASNPGLVYLSITGFGQTGPRAREAGYDAALQAQSGLLAMSGEPNGRPVKTPVAFIDVMTGLHGAVGVLAALHERGRTGVGAHIDLSLFDVALAGMVNQTQGAILTGEPPVRLGSAHPNIVPYQAFDAADGAVVLAVGNDAQFAKLCGVLGIPERATDVRFSTNGARVQNRAELVAELQGLTSAWTRSELLAACASVGVPATAVLTLPEALRDVQAGARGSIVSGNHPSIGELEMVASPLWHVSRPDGTRASEVPARGEAAVPPRMGEHTRRVLSLDLALTEDEIDALLADGVIGAVA